MSSSRQPTWTFDDLLDAVPTPNSSARTETADTGVHITVPTRRRWWMKPLSLIMPFRREPKRTLALDSLGREVWEMADGQTPTEMLIDRFAAAHGLSFHEARLSVTQFLRTLTYHGAIVVVAPTKDGETG
jgi:hypothetical protein